MVDNACTQHLDMRCTRSTYCMLCHDITMFKKINWVSLTALNAGTVSVMNLAQVYFYLPVSRPTTMLYPGEAGIADIEYKNHIQVIYLRNNFINYYYYELHKAVCCAHQGDVAARRRG